MAAHVVNVEDRPNLEQQIERPGEAAKPGSAEKFTRFLGLPGEDFVSPKQAPFAYHIRRPRGDVTPDHCHTANRTEFLIEGKIEWREPGAEPVVYGAGTLTYVEAGTVYGYTVIEDATILILFDRSPGMNYR
jgi:quercetin dioxygenase-like cupin family protein